MLTCVVRGCLSDENTKIDGKNVLLFPFPENVAQRNAWTKNCQLLNTPEIEKQLYVCELHFDKINFTSLQELKPDVVPTIFDKVEEGQRKRKIENIVRSSSSDTPPLKQEKLDDDSHSLVTPPQSPCTQLVPNVEEINVKDRVDISSEHEVSLNGSFLRSELYQELEIGKKVYRLAIQIDKIYGKPCPKSKKLMILAQLKRGKPQLSARTFNTGQKGQSLLKVQRKAACVKGGCKLKKSIYQSKPALQCQHCDKYYVIKKNDNQEETANACNICSKAFPSPRALYFHVKTHFVCDMCQTECSTQVTYDKHRRLHVSTDPLYPYKCNQCAEVFELKEDVRQHCLIVHPRIKLQNTILQMATPTVTQQVPQQQEYRCVKCNVTFRNEQGYRNHMNSHKKKEGLRCSISDANNIFPVPNPLTGSQIGILRAVKFSCRVCSMEFDNVAEVDKHTRTHLEEEVEEEHKCNICQKQFKTNGLLSEHLKYHLSRAHPCPICSKAFINRTTLKAHLKTHSES